MLSPLCNSTAFNFYEDAEDNWEEFDLDSAALIDSQSTRWILHDEGGTGSGLCP